MRKIALALIAVTGFSAVSAYANPATPAPTESPAPSPSPSPAPAPTETPHQH